MMKMMMKVWQSDVDGLAFQKEALIPNDDDIDDGNDDGGGDVDEHGYLRCRYNDQGLVMIMMMMMMITANAVTCADP